MLEKQIQFTKMVCKLIMYADSCGFDMTFGDAYRDDRVKYGHPKSLHRKRLAIDLNLFREGKYLDKTEDHEILGEYWESIGGTWGGRFGDGNHYSLSDGGMR